MEFTHDSDLPCTAVSQQQSPSTGLLVFLNLQQTESKFFPSTFLLVQGVHLRLYTVDSLLIFFTLAFLVMHGTTLQNLHMVCAFGITVPCVGGGRR